MRSQLCSVAPRPEAPPPAVPPPGTSSSGAPPVLVLDGFGVAFGDRVVLAEVTLQLPARGTCVLMGPAGGGKSTLLRALAGFNLAQPDLRQWGDARYEGRPLGEGRRPVLVHQDIRYFTSTVRENLMSSFPDRAAQPQRIAELLAACDAEDLADRLDEDAFGLPLVQRRLLGVLRAVGSGAPMICLDESTAGLDAAAADRVLRVIRWYARDHAVLFVTHHQSQARDVADQVVLLGGGRVQEQRSGEAFFASASTTVAGHFLGSGGLPLPAPGTPPEALREDQPPPPPLPPPAGSPPAWFVGPRDFRWIIQGRLGGLPRPGIVASLAHDLSGLCRLGITTLVTLEESLTVPPDELALQGIHGLHFPIVDMEAPEVSLAADWCREIAIRLQAGEIIAMHCRAGHGRTGTMLASQLIWGGSTAVEALELARGINPRWVTSGAQVRFLARFHEHVRQMTSSAP